MIRRLWLKVCYCWRVFATGFCFSVFGLGGIVLALTLLPAVRYWPGTPHQQNSRARKLVHHTFGLFIGLMNVMGCNAVVVEGKEKLRNTAGQLVIANHPSLIDVVILIACIPDCCCIVKQSLWRNPFMGAAVRCSGYISNSDPEALIHQCRETLANGCSIIVFPEGTRTIEGESLKFQRGAANIAVRCQADMIPVTIRPDPPTLRKGEPWYHVPERRSIFSVKVLEPIRVKDVVDEQAEQSLATRKLNRYLQNYYQGLLNYG